MRAFRSWGWALAVALLAGAAAAAPLSRAEALAALAQPDPGARLAAVERLAEIGTMPDADRLLDRMHDGDPRVRASSAAALWRIWGRSGDPAIDRLFARGVAQMEAAALGDALATFNEIVRRKPAFAEGWNKRATILFLLGENERSLQDCDQVFRRNPNHFGALSGAAQIHLQMGNVRSALGFLRRALAVNPDLQGAAELIPSLEQHLREQERKTI